MTQELAGKVTIVTGASNGLGRAIVELFLEEGAKVVAADIDEAGGKELLSLGASVRFKKTDVSNEDDMRSLVDYTVKEFGALNAMINNAGISSSIVSSFLDLEFKDFQRVMNVNVLGVMLGTQHAARHMAKHGGGSVVNVASIAGLLAGVGPMTYRASKAAVVQLSKCLAIDLARHAIRVNCIAPGNVVTRMVQSAVASGSLGSAGADSKKVDQAYREVMLQMQPMKRQGQPRDVAQATLFYASDRSAQVTGTILPVDGGITAGDPVNRAEQILNVHAKLAAQ